MNNSDKINDKINDKKKYLETHSVTKYIEELMSALMKEKPEEPLLFMIQFIQEKAKQKGIYIPHQSVINTTEVCDNGCEINGRYYNKPWLNMSVKNNTSSLHHDIVNSDNNSNELKKDSSHIGSNNIEEEFQLVTPDVDSFINPIESNNNEFSIVKNSKRESESKVKILKLVREEADNKLTQKQKLEEGINEKQILCAEYDCACELAEDPDVGQNELNFSNSTSSKPTTAIVIKKQMVDNTIVKMTLCHNCAKMYQLEYGGSSQEQSSSIYGQNSVILDDIESASQVNGPRPISEKNTQAYQPSNSKKIISVNDIEASAKGWSVLDSGSESSLNRRSLARTRQSARQFQN